MGFLTLQPRGNGVLWVTGHIKFDAKFGAGAAGLALAHHGQGGRAGCVEQLHVRLKPHRVGQAGFQHGHIHNPGQGRHGQVCCGKIHRAAVVAPDLHASHRCGVLGVGPAAH